MPQTSNFGLPLWGDTPPEGATGKTLRDAIIGQGAESLAQRVDALAQLRANMSTSAENSTIPNDDGRYPSCALVRQALQAVSVQGGACPPVAFNNEKAQLPMDLIGDTGSQIQIGRINLLDENGEENPDNYLFLHVIRCLEEPMQADRIAIAVINSYRSIQEEYNVPLLALPDNVEAQMQTSTDGHYRYACWNGYPLILTCDGAGTAPEGVPWTVIQQEEASAYPTQRGTYLFLYELSVRTGPNSTHTYSDLAIAASAHSLTAAYDPIQMSDAVMELRNNMVRTIRDEPDDYHYPSEKAVNAAVSVATEAKRRLSFPLLADSNMLPSFSALGITSAPRFAYCGDLEGMCVVMESGERYTMHYNKYTSEVFGISVYRDDGETLLLVSLARPMYESYQIIQAGAYIIGTASDITPKLLEGDVSLPWKELMPMQTHTVDVVSLTRDGSTEGLPVAFSEYYRISDQAAVGDSFTATINENGTQKNASGPICFGFLNETIMVAAATMIEGEDMPEGYALPLAYIVTQETQDEDSETVLPGIYAVGGITSFTVKSEVRTVQSVQEYVDSVLPPVTAADNGKILKVVDGKWMLVSQ